MRERPLGHILSSARDDVRLIDDNVYVTAGILSYGRGLFERPAVRGAETSYKTYFRLRRNQFVYSKLFAWEGALAVVGDTFDGLYVSQEFPTFDIDLDEADPDYLRVVCSWPTLWERLRAGQTGMGGRRRRVHPDHLLATLIPLPSLMEQRRIVDLVASLDGVSDRSLRIVAAARRATESLLAEAFAVARETRMLGSLMMMRSGPSWNSDDESQAPREGSTPVLKITNTRPDGQIRLDESTYVANLPLGIQLLDESSLVLIRTNGNRNRIGNVYRATPEMAGYAVSAFQISGKPVDPSDRDYVYWFLRAPQTQQAMTNAASGSTGLGNIAIKWLRELSVPWLDVETRTQVVAACDALEGVVDAAQSEVAALEHVRSSLLDDVLTGNREIPVSYDALLEKVS